MTDRLSSAEVKTTLDAIRAALGRVIHGKSEVIELLLVGVLAGGHVLVEDVPGVGKTTLAKALARAFRATFTRVQFTPDLLPSDILGSQVLDPKEGRFSFHRGPVFTHVLLADEINRASPRTQSALLEAMSEAQATIDGTTHPLPSPFFVIATQNGSGRGVVVPSTDTCPSFIASSSADCVRGLARLISSARSTFAKIGPWRRTNFASRWS